MSSAFSEYGHPLHIDPTRSGKMTEHKNPQLAELAAAHISVPEAFASPSFSASEKQEG